MDKGRICAHTKLETVLEDLYRQHVYVDVKNILQYVLWGPDDLANVRTHNGVKELKKYVQRRVRQDYFGKDRPGKEFWQSLEALRCPRIQGTRKIAATMQFAAGSLAKVM